MPIFRRGETGDLEECAVIQQASPEAAMWDVAAYPALDFWVGEVDGEVAGFLVARIIDSAESELLNLAVAPRFRRRGIGRGLFQAFAATAGGVVFLEVRESNSAARNLYKSLGFQEVGVRKKYYERSPESAIVLRLHS